MANASSKQWYGQGMPPSATFRGTKLEFLAFFWTTNSATGGHGRKSATSDSKNFAKNLEKEGQIRKKEEKLGRKGENRGGSFTLPLLTDRVGYATHYKATISWLKGTILLLSLPLPFWSWGIIDFLPWAPPSLAMSLVQKKHGKLSMTNCFSWRLSL